VHRRKGGSITKIHVGATPRFEICKAIYWLTGKNHTKHTNKITTRKMADTTTTTPESTSPITNEQILEQAPAQQEEEVVKKVEQSYVF